MRTLKLEEDKTLSKMRYKLLTQKEIIFKKLEKKVSFAHKIKIGKKSPVLKISSVNQKEEEKDFVAEKQFNDLNKKKEETIAAEKGCKEKSEEDSDSRKKILKIRLLFL